MNKKRQSKIEQSEGSEVEDLFNNEEENEGNH
jgi:hypothetical protein